MIARFIVSTFAYIWQTASIIHPQPEVSLLNRAQKQLSFKSLTTSSSLQTPATSAYSSSRTSLQLFINHSILLSHLESYLNIPGTTLSFLNIISCKTATVDPDQQLHLLHRSSVPRLEWDVRWWYHSEFRGMVWTTFYCCVVTDATLWCSGCCTQIL